MLRVLHSMHASYDELCAFVTHLSPRSVVPCVIPYSIGDTSIVDLHDRYCGCGFVIKRGFGFI